MLPESFAVVCAPQHTPKYVNVILSNLENLIYSIHSFGIFRLTDPPGLQAILACDARDAFHPHPDLPIYTDADKGHVSLCELPLEIVDLR